MLLLRMERCRSFTFTCRLLRYIFLPVVLHQGLPADGDVFSRLIEKLGLIEVGNVACSCSHLTSSGGRLRVIKLYYISVQETLLNGHFTYFTEQDDREQKESDGGENEAFPASLMEYRTIISLGLERHGISTLKKPYVTFRRHLFITSLSATCEGIVT